MNSVQQSVQSIHFTDDGALTRMHVMLLILSLSVLATSFLSGIFGMAGGMVLMGVLLLVLSVEKAMVVHGMAQFASNGWRALMWSGSIRWSVVRGYSAGAALVFAVMLGLDATLSRPAVLVILGITPFLVFVLPARLQLNVDERGHSFACGLVCMAIQMLSGVSGPLLDTFFVRSSMSRHEVVSTKAAVQTLSHAVRIAFFGNLLASSGRTFDAAMGAVVLASAIIGTSASKFALDRLSDANFRSITRSLVLVLGGCYLATGLWQLAR
jgi:uncharacterized protein